MTAIAPGVAARHLKVDSSREGEVADVLRRAESHIADKVGPLAETQVVERVKGRNSLILSTTPVIELTAVVSIDGDVLDVDDLHLEDGIITWPDERAFIGRGYDITYRAGWAAEGDQLPGSLETAVLELLRHLWRASEKGGSGRRAGTAADESRPPGFLLPYAVASAIEQYLPDSGFA